jgi:hypothetical protein
MAVFILSLIIFAVGLINDTTHTVAVWLLVIIAGFIFLHGLQSGSYRGQT